MNLRNAAGGLSRFAHLAGLRATRTTAGAPAAEEDQDEKDEAAKAKAEEDEKDMPDEDEGDKDARAEEDDKKPDDEDDAKAAASAERARCAAIFAAPEAAANLSLAAHLAFETDLTAKQAVGALRAGGMAAEQPRRSSLSERMERQPKANLGTGGNAGPDMSTAAGAAAFILGAGRAAQKEG